MPDMMFEGDPYIPTATAAEIDGLLVKVRPLLPCGERGGAPFTIPKDVDPRNASYSFAGSEGQPEYGAHSLVEVGRLTTHHTCGYYGFFKPSEAEVVAHLAKAIRDDPASPLSRATHYTVWLPDDGPGAITDGRGSHHSAEAVFYAGNDNA